MIAYHLLLVQMKKTYYDDMYQDMHEILSDAQLTTLEKLTNKLAAIDINDNYNESKN